MRRSSSLLTKSFSVLSLIFSASFIILPHLRQKKSPFAYDTKKPRRALRIAVPAGAEMGLWSIPYQRFAVSL